MSRCRDRTSTGSSLRPSRPALPSAVVINQGRVLGGSTSINAMMYVRGHPRNFDMWNAQGRTAGAMPTCCPTLRSRRISRAAPPNTTEWAAPLTVRECPDDVMRSEQFMLAARRSASMARTGTRTGNARKTAQVCSISTSARTASAPAPPPLSSVPSWTAPTSRSLRAQKWRAFSSTALRRVRRGIRQSGQTHTVRADRIIVSGGAFLSPKLLMLSGIGPADTLRQHGLPVVQDLTGVGRNLHRTTYSSRRISHQSQSAQHDAAYRQRALRTHPPRQRRAAPTDLQLNFTPSVPGPWPQCCGLRRTGLHLPAHLGAALQHRRSYAALVNPPTRL